MLTNFLSYELTWVFSHWLKESMTFKKIHINTTSTLNYMTAKHVLTKSSCLCTFQVLLQDTHNTNPIPTFIENVCNTFLHA